MHNILFAFRYLLKPRGGNLARLVSLTLALTVSIVVFSYVNYVLTFDRFYPDVARIYQIWDFDDEGNISPSMIAPLGPALQEEIPAIEAATRLRGNFEQELCRDNHAYDARIVAVDSMFFRVLDFGLIKGDMAAFTGHDKLMLSESFARTIFGESDPIGQIVLYENATPRTVVGIFRDPPRNTHLGSFNTLIPFDALAGSFYMGWDGGDSFPTYLKLRPGQTPADVEALLPALFERHGLTKRIEQFGSHYLLLPVTRSAQTGSTLVQTTRILLALALLILFVGVMNYVLLSISSLASRAKTFAMLRCNGARRAHLGAADRRAFRVPCRRVSPRTTLCRDTTHNRLSGHEFRPPLVETPAAWSRVVLRNRCLRPAYGIFHAAPPPALRRFRIRRLTGRLHESGRHARPVAQHGGGLHGDARSRGCRRDGPAPRMGLQRTALLRRNNPRDALRLPHQLHRRELPRDDGHAPDRRRQLHPAKCSARRAGERNLLPAAGMESGGALGRRICNSSGQAPEDYHTIRGVVHDFRTEVASGLVEPIVLHNLNEWMPREDRAYGHTNLCLRLHEITPEVLKAVSEKLHAFETADNYRIRVLDTLIDETLRTERRVHDLTLLAGSIVLLITLVGLTGYLGDEMRRRSREIAIRKVNGASAADIFALLTRSTAALTFPAVAAGTLAGYLVLARLLELFVERIALRWWIFAGAAAAVIGLVLVILLLRIRRMATENPINRIKTE